MRIETLSAILDLLSAAAFAMVAVSCAHARRSKWLTIGFALAALVVAFMAGMSASR